MVANRYRVPVLNSAVPMWPLPVSSSLVAVTSSTAAK